MVFPGVQHRLKKYWGENALEFYPERWLENSVQKNLYTYMPFLGNPIFL
jgi:cytochrome P450